MSAPTLPEPVPNPPLDPAGVDLALIQYTLSLTPLQRLELLQYWIDGLAEPPSPTA